MNKTISVDITGLALTSRLVTMSYTLTLKSRSSVLQGTYFPPIDLSRGQWAISLIGLETYNSIPNITVKNNKLHLKSGGVVEIPPGTYDIDDLNEVFKESGKGIELRANINTFKSQIRTKDETIIFNQDDSIGPLLGFSRERVLEADPIKFHESDTEVDILPVKTIRVECNIATNSYLNDRLIHTIYGFFPTVGPGYKIVESPSNVIYLPVTVEALDRLELRIVDQDDHLVDFRGEEIIVRLHLKQENESLL